MATNAETDLERFLDGLWSGFKAVASSLWDLVPQSNIFSPFTLGYIVGMALFIILVVFVVNRLSG